MSNLVDNRYHAWLACHLTVSDSCVHDPELGYILYLGHLKCFCFQLTYIFIESFVFEQHVLFMVFSLCYI